MMIAPAVATVATGLFAGAALYVSLVEHPARVECGPVPAIEEFGPSYRRGDRGSAEARLLLSRWARLHAVRTVVGVAVFAAFALLSGRP